MIHPARLVSILGLVLAGLDAGAATFVVTSTTDGADANPGDGVCSWMTGICTLRAAVQEANAWPGADVIQLPAGTFTLALAGAGEDAAATGDLDLTGDVTITGLSAAATVIDGGGIDRVFAVLGYSVPISVTIQDVTIRGGAVTGAEAAGIQHSNPGLLRVTDAVLRQNQVSGPASCSYCTGGAIASNADGSLVVERVEFLDNQADRGGAIFHNGTLEARDSTFDANTARAGSAILAYDDATVERCTFVGNEATGDGTISIVDGSFVLQNATLTANENPYGVVVALALPPVSLESVTVFANAGSDTSLETSNGPVSIVNSVLWGSSGPECRTYGSGTITSLGHNLVEDGSCGAGPGDLPAVDPQLAALADNGGPTRTHLPAPGSPLANAGLAGACLLEDQRGILRNVGPANGCDVGSVEFAVPEAGPRLAGAVALAALALLRVRAPRKRLRSAARGGSWRDRQPSGPW